MRLGTKIIIGFFCISFLLAFVGFVSDFFTSSVRQEQIRFVNEASSVVIYTGKMESNLYQSLILLNAYKESMSAAKNELSNVQEFPSLPSLREGFLNELDEFEQTCDSLESHLGEHQASVNHLAQLKKSYTVYKSIADEWLKLGNDDTELANMMFITSIEPYFRNNIIPQLSALRTYVLDLQENYNQELNDSLANVDLANIIATILSILMAVALAVYIYRSIANPLNKLSSSVTKLGEGKLDERIEVHSKDEIGDLAAAFNKMAESIEQKTVSKEYVDNILESIHEAIFVSDIDGKLTRFNSAAESLLGYESGELMQRSLNEFMDLQEIEPKVSEPNISFEFNLIKKNNGKVPVLFSEANLYDSQGKMVGTVSVASDISQQKQMESELRSSLREKEVMLAEIHHRVKNNLAVISGLLQLQSFSSENEEVKKALTDSQLRIQSIALVHEMLYENETLAYINYDNYINDLLQAISSMYQNDGQQIKLETELEPIKLSINKAIPCSLLLNELVVNSFKHAFKDVNSGQIYVSLSQQANKIILILSDNGRGFTENDFNNSGSLGSTLIKTLVNQLKGKFEILQNKEGVSNSFKIEFQNEG